MGTNFFDITYDEILADKTGQIVVIMAWYRACEKGDFIKADRLWERFQRLIKR